MIFYQDSRKHWICMDCEVWNGLERLRCLGCSEPREEVELRDQVRYDKLYEQFNGKKNFKSKKEKVGGLHGNH